jgi:hypothetical protein
MCSNMQMERRKFWWNGKWGRLARRDVLLYEDGGAWWVEAREGGAEGRSRWFEFADEDAATDCVRMLIAGTERWREL